MKNPISNTDDIIDSRDVIARIEELTDERDSLQSDLDEAQADLDALTDADADAYALSQAAVTDARDAMTEWNESAEADELRILESLQSDAEGCASDWHCGSSLIRDSYFVEYCEEMVKDVGDLPQNIPPYLVIDWEKTADNLRVDYTSVDFDDIEYWVR